MLGLGNLLTKSGVIKKFPNDFSFNFDGSNDYLDCGDSLGNSLGTTTTLTLSVWVKNNNSSQDAGIFKIGDGSAGNFSLSYANNKYYLNLDTNDSNPSAYAGFTNTDTSSWHHIVAIYNGTNAIAIYFDGSAQSLSGSGTPPSSIGFTGLKTLVGQYYSSEWDGLIDEVAVWSVALSADDIAKLSSKPLNLSKASTYATDRTANLKLWLRAGDKVLPESDTSIARSDFYTDFDGSNDYVELSGDIGQSLTDANAFSVSSWINPTDVSTFGNTIITGRDRSTFSIQRHGTGLLIYVANNVIINLGTLNKFANNKWSHVVVTYDEVNLKYYIDGELVGTQASTVSINVHGSIKSLYIGAQNGTSAFFTGAISNLSIYQTALDAQTISQMAKSRYTPMRDNRFSVVDFDGSNPYIDCGDVTYLNSVSAFTFSVWIKSDNTNSTDYILSKYSSSTTRIHLSIASNLLFFNLSNGGHAYASVSFTSTDWTHVAMVFDGSGTGNSGRLKGYVNGVEQSLSYVGTVGTATTNLSGQSFEIGKQVGNTFEGQMSNVAVYSDAKGSDFIYAQYSKGITHNPSADTGLVGLWRMGDDTSKAYPTIADSSSNSNDGTITNGASDDIVQQMVAGYDMGAFESTGEELNGNVMLNGDFASGDLTSWGAVSGGSAMSVVNNSLVHAVGTSGGVRQAVTLTSGVLYKGSFDILEITSGNNGNTTIQITIYNYAGSSIKVALTQYSVGTNTFYFVPDDNGIWFEWGTGNGFTIDNFTLKTVLQSADLSDTYPAIIDVNEPVLGAELLITTGWTTADGWGLSNGILTFNDTGSGGTILSASDMTNSGLATGTTYKLQYTIGALSSGTADIRIQDSNGNTMIDTKNLTNGSYTEYFSATSTNNGLGFRFTGLSSSGSSWTITDYSLKEIQGNVGTMTNQDSADLVYSSVLPDQSFLTGVNSAYNFIDLDGIDAYVSVPVSGTVTNFSIGGWFNADVFENTNMWEWGTSSSERLAVWTWDNDFIVKLKDQSLTTDAHGLSTGAWFHVMLNYDSSTLTVYLNGSSFATASHSNISTTPSGNLSIGQDTSASQGYQWNGQVSGFVYFNKSLSTPEINAIYTAGRHTNLLDSYSDNLKAYFAFGALDSSTGLPDTDSTIYDRSGNSNHGTPSGIATGDLKSPPNAEPNGYAKGDTNRSTTTP
jgi:hypothetical protein